MGSRVIAAALALIVSVGVLAGCGGNGSGPSKFETVKLSYAGEMAWIVVGVPGHEKALASELLHGVRSTGASASLTTSKPRGPLSCGHDIQIGNDQKVFEAIRQYAGQTASIKVYGSSSLAHGVCHGLLSSFGGG